MIGRFIYFITEDSSKVGSAQGKSMMVDREKGADGEDSSAQGVSPSAPTISLPKGGGAIRGIGEKFAANPVTGTGSMSVPIATRPGRSGFGPQLSLNYDSGAGNGAFGLGWSLSLPAITRKTDKGLPQYVDLEESDVFILSGAEDLVPLLVKNGDTWTRENLPVRNVNGVDYRIQRYRPRIEGLFARIERWTNLDDEADVSWRSISKDNITTWYGKTSESRVVDPSDPKRIFSWLICESYDDKGDAIRYEFKVEDSQGIDLSASCESNRTDKIRSSNRYPKRIHYGNRAPRVPLEDLSQRSDWLFEVVFDYGEHYMEDAKGQPISVFLEDDQRLWSVRQDPFSAYRARFEVPTYRLCQRVLMFHHFPDELGTPDYLVRATEFTYAQSPIASFISSVTQSGFLRRTDGTYHKASLPSLEFTYSEATIQGEVFEVDLESLENLPYGLDSSNYQWIDLDGEGLSGILTEQAEGWFYKRNLSPINTVVDDGADRVEASFGPVEVVASKPALSLANQGQFMDLAGDGQPDFVTFQGPAPGFYERTEDAGWESFRSFPSFPNLDARDPNLKFIDLDGDGHNDILISENDFFRWHLSLAEDGFGSSEFVSQARDEEKGPKLVFADGTQSIYLADLSGDGLTDLVRIRNGEVCYWPSLGYGVFGAKVTMDRAPWFDYSDQFDQKRIRLVDIDGSGTTDIIYLGADQIDIYRNQSGNSWSNRESLTNFPRLDNLCAVQAVDLLGNGTTCLVWSSSLAGDALHPMRYIDLMGSQKPHLLIKTINNLGAETVIAYAPSTKFYLQDKLAGRPWVTKLPFPVHVVERVETIDRISRNRFVTRHAYHHGNFDGSEREFRGFGMVEQFDTEEYATLSASDALPDATNIDETFHVPPIRTKTWFHTGAYLDGERITKQFEHEYYREGDQSLGESALSDKQVEAMLLPDTILPTDMTADEEREACRALKGSTLRVEIYADDGSSEESDRPYSVSERNYTVAQLQPKGENQHAVFFAHLRESIDFHYERTLYDIGGQQLSDPRVSHAITLAVDEFGNVLQSAAVGYGRRHDDPDPLLTIADRDKQKRSLATYTENQFTNSILLDDDYRAPLPYESRTFELLNVAPTSNEPVVTNLFPFDDLLNQIQAASDGQHDLPYEDIQGSEAQAGHPYRRLIEHARTLYRQNDLIGSLPMGQLESLALPFESYKLAFTPGVLAQVYADRVSDAVLASEGNYIHSEADANWWIPSGRSFYSRAPGDTPAAEFTEAQAHFFLARRFQDPFGNNAFIDLDAYDILPGGTEDSLHNTVSAESDYRVLAPFRMIDSNGNRAEVVFDTLGMVVGTALMGKVSETKGDLIDSTFNPDLDDATIQAHIANPLANPQDILQKATTRLIYDLFAYQRSKDTSQPQPAVVYALARETHHFDLGPGEQTKIQHGFSYSDGFGREIQKKIQAERGPLDFELDNAPIANPRWVGSGWTIFNNKGKSVRKYEPFFDDTHAFKFGQQVGVSSTLFYDPVERVVSTLRPNHTWEKVVFDPWRQASFDVNDTVTFDPKTDLDAGDFFNRLPDVDYLPTWYAQRIGGELGTEEQQAASKAAAHADTPAVVYFDTLGRPFLTVAHNKFTQNGNLIDEKYLTRSNLDIEGNQREVIDAKSRIVMRYDYDMLGNKIHQASMEAGERWLLNDVSGKPIRSWDSRGHVFRTEYDALRRPVRSFVQGTDPINSDPQTLNREILFALTDYGEEQPNDVALNLRTRVFRLSDGAGLVTHLGHNPATDQDEAYDFKGNLLRSTRQLAQDYKTAPDWSGTPPLEAEIFANATTFDALNRPITLTTPDNSIIRPGYNEGNLLETMEVNLRGATTSTAFVTNIDYDAKGQRVLIEYGNHTRTTYDYDPLTFRLIRLRTTRPQGLNGLATSLFKNPTIVQDLRYTYDPAGNITAIRDDALLTVFFNNEQVDSNVAYTHDAIYRLIAARGREHIAQTAFAPQPPVGNLRDYPLVGLSNNPNDVHALRNYTEQYQYDAVGNFEAMIHVASNGNWTRSYSYAEPSLMEPEKLGNRLSSTTVGATTGNYLYDLHGSVTQMPHLPVMEWDFKDQLHASQQQVVNNGSGERTYYVYDGTGQRVRKVTERGNGTKKQERLYFGGFEVYREYAGDDSAVTLERETLHIMDDKRRIARVETKTTGLDTPANTLPSILTRYQFDNHLGSASIELDETGSIISCEEYYPFGNTSFQAGRSTAEVSLKGYRYTGKERDDETGLYYYGARYYAPWLARWTRCDPAGTADGVNLYAYVRNCPISLADSTGRQSRRPSFEERMAGTSGVQLLTPGASTKEGIEAIEENVSSAQRRAAASFERSLAVRGSMARGAPDLLSGLQAIIPYATKKEGIEAIEENMPRDSLDPEMKRRWGYDVPTGESIWDPNDSLYSRQDLVVQCSNGLPMCEEMVRYYQDHKRLTEIGVHSGMAMPLPMPGPAIEGAGPGGIGHPEPGLNRWINVPEALKFDIKNNSPGPAGNLTQQTGPRVAVGRNVTEGFQYGAGKNARIMIVQEGEAYYRSAKGTGGKQAGAWYRFYGVAEPAPEWVGGEKPWVGKQQYAGGPLLMRPDLAGTEVLGPMETGGAAEANAWLASRGVNLLYDAPPPTKR